MTINRFTQWPLFILSIILMGVSFPISFFRADEKAFFADNFGLNTKDGAGKGDSVQEAFEDLGKDGMWLHSIKNITHEWTKEYPKRAAKFLSFLILVSLLLGFLF